MLKRALNQAMQKERKHYYSHKGYYQVKAVEPYKTEFGIEVYFEQTELTATYYVRFKDIDLPEGFYKPYGEYIFLESANNTMLILYHNSDGLAKCVTIDLEIYIDAILEEESANREIQYTQEEF